jgi:RHO1 GDP-GTP exchange protein 1/2
MLPASEEEWHKLVPPEAREALGKHEVERQSVLFELFKAEKDYVNDLRLVREVKYLFP